MGGTAIFNVGVTGGLPAITFQWRQNGTNLAGATASAYTVNNAQETNGGLYSVVIADYFGQTITSANAGLVVGAAGKGTGLKGGYFNSPKPNLHRPPAPPPPH